MNNHSIVDGVLEDFDAARNDADNWHYGDVVNPADGVVYPGICANLPEYVVSAVQQVADNYLSRKAVLHVCFARLSTEGANAPHQAHTDSVMGAHSLMLYMNRAEHCRGGTSLVRHVSGLCTDPVNEDELELWQCDHSNPDKWSVDYLCAMVPNRAFVFPSRMMHRAEPLGGFGSDATNGRLVVTGFFS